MPKWLTLIALLALTATAQAQYYKDALWIKAAHLTASSVAPTPDGRLLLSGGSDGLKLWDVEKQNLIKSMDTLPGVYSLAMLPDGRHAAVACGTYSIQILDIVDWKLERHMEGESRYYLTVAVSRDGRYIAAGAYDGSVRVWKAEDGSLVATFIKHTDQAPAVAFSPDGDTLVSGGHDHKVFVYHIPTKKVIDTRTYEDRVTAIGYTPLGGEVVFGSSDGKVTLFDVKRGSRLRTVETLKNWTILSISYSHDGRFFVAGTAWGARAFSKDGSPGPELAGPVGECFGAVFSQDDRRVFSAHSTGDIVVTSAPSWKLDGFLTDFVGGAFAACFSPDGRFVAGSTAGLVLTYDAELGIRQREFFSRLSNFYGVAFSPDGAFVAGATTNGKLMIWNHEIDSGGVVYTREDRAFVELAYSPDGRRIAMMTEGGIVFWDVVAGKVDTEWASPGFPANTISYSPDGTYLATDGKDGILRVWDVASGTVLQSFSVPGSIVIRTTFSNDGSFLSYSTSGGDAVVRRVSDWEVVRTVHHGGVVSGVGFSPNNAYLVTAGWDSTINVWDVGTGESVYSYKSYPSPINGIRVSPNGKYILAATLDGLVQYAAHWGTSSVTSNASPLFAVELGAPVPNPARSTATIRFELAGASGHVPVQLTLLDALGNEIRRILDGELDPGPHSVAIDCGGLGSGTYFYRLTTATSSRTRLLRIVR